MRGIAATVHQNEDWPDVTPEGIIKATARLSEQLLTLGIPLLVYPVAEVMVEPDIDRAWSRGDLLTLADRGEYLLIELPHGMFFDLRGLVCEFVERGVRPILAHPERHLEFVQNDEAVENLISCGCLVQVSAASSRISCFSCRERV